MKPKGYCIEWYLFLHHDPTQARHRGPLLKTFDCKNLKHRPMTREEAENLCERMNSFGTRGYHRVVEYIPQEGDPSHELP